MAVDPSKAVLFIEGNQVRYKQGGYNGIIKSFNSKPISAVFQGIDVIVTLENGQIRRIEGPSYSLDRSV
jgi:hypothetical protein